MSWIVDNTPLWVWMVLLGGGGSAALVFIPGLMTAVGAIWVALPKTVKILLGIMTFGAAAYAGGRYQGRQNEQTRRDAANAQANQRRTEIDDEIRNSSDAGLDKRASRWMRD